MSDNENTQVEKKNHSKTFFQNHKAEKYECLLCNVSVCKFNKSHHTSSKKHKLAQSIVDKYTKSE